MVQVHPDPPFVSLNMERGRGRSSIGRASVLHAEGQEFDSPRLHQCTVYLTAECGRRTGQFFLQKVVHGLFFNSWKLMKHRFNASEMDTESALETV